MATQQLSERLSKVRKELEAIEGELAAGALPDEGLADFKLTVDHIRMTTWAALSAEQAQRGGPAANPVPRIASFRIQRATAMCRNAIKDIETGSISPDALEVGEFYAALADGADRVRRAIEATG